MLAASASLADRHPSEPPLEIELKLSLPPAQARQFWKTPPIRTLLSGRPSHHHLFSAYYDTPQLDLQERCVALRLRRQGRRWVQTLKTAGKDTGALQRRVELEVNVTDGVLDIDWLKHLSLPEFGGREFPTIALGIVFTTGKGWCWRCGKALAETFA